MFKVVKLIGFQVWDGKDGKIKTIELNVLDGNNTKTVKFYQKESDELPFVDQEFGDDYEIVKRRDKKDQEYLLLHKKQEKKQWTKKEVSPKSYMINTCLPSVFPDVMKGTYTVMQVTDKMQEFIDWSEK